MANTSLGGTTERLKATVKTNSSKAKQVTTTVFPSNKAGKMDRAKYTADNQFVLDGDDESTSKPDNAVGGGKSERQSRPEALKNTIEADSSSHRKS